jgi:hypothetical protein
MRTLRSIMPSILPSGPVIAVLVDFAVGRRIRRHGEHMIPQRARAQQPDAGLRRDAIIVLICGRSASSSPSRGGSGAGR